MCAQTRAFANIGAGRLRCLLALCGIMLALTSCAIPVSGFRPIDPPVTRSFGLTPQDMIAWPTVDSLRPTLRWQAFPGEHQQYVSSQVEPFVGFPAHAIRDVTYELRIWTVISQRPADLVYEVNGLTQPFHAVAQDLKPSSSYYWSVRARFLLYGDPRVSDWSVTQLPCPPPYGSECARGVVKRTGQIPPLNYYRFRTPDH